MLPMSYGWLYDNMWVMGSRSSSSSSPSYAWALEGVGGKHIHPGDARPRR
jgi:hypothetical protein